MAEEFSEENETLLSQIDNALKDSIRKSGAFNSLSSTGTPLFYPYDLLRSDTDSNEKEIVNWLEFRVFTKESSGLEGIYRKIADSTREVEGLDDFSEEEVLSVALNELKGDTKQRLREDGPYTDEYKEKLAKELVEKDTRIGRATEKSRDSIYLYVPGELQFSDGFEYEQTSFSAIKNIGTATATKGVIAIGGLRKLAGFADKASSLLGESEINAGGAIAQSLGVVLNPRKEQTFKGVESRSFSFKFTFAPRNEKEAITAANIVKTFRFHAYPELSSNSAFLHLPSEFELKFRTYDPLDGMITTNPVLPKIGRCYLQKVSTDYTPNGVMNSFKNGIPPKFNLEVTFVETEIITRQHVYLGY